MFRSSSVKVAAAVVAVIAVLALLRFQPWSRHSDGGESPIHYAPTSNARQALTVAYLPVTCHLTCPVTDYASQTTTTGTQFNSKRFTEFPPIARR